MRNEWIKCFNFEAKFWLDDTGEIDPPEFINDNNRLHMMFEYGFPMTHSPEINDWATRANFCLLIAADLESML